MSVPSVKPRPVLRGKPTGPRKFHFNIYLLVATLAVLGVLLGLGTWQANRYQESTEVLKHYRHQHDELSPVTSMATDVGDAPREEVLRFRRVKLKGKLVLPELQLLTARYKFAQPGYGLLVPLKLSEGPHEKILVYLGWVPRDKLEGFLKDLGSKQEVEISGRLNQGDGKPSTEEPVGEHLGYPTWRNTNLPTLLGRIDGLDPQLLIQSGAEANGQTISLDDLPLDGYKVPLRMPPEKHVEYSMTWYGVALALIAVFLAYSFRRTRLPGDDPEDPSAVA